jgi:alpha-L-fucosidase
MNQFEKMLRTLSLIVVSVFVLFQFDVRAASSDVETVKDEHAIIGVDAVKDSQSPHTMHPDAQWYPDAGLGLFIHWGISSVKAMNISWPMIPGRPLSTKRITDTAEIERIVHVNFRTFLVYHEKL